jgi:hypothetical protein
MSEAEKDPVLENISRVFQLLKSPVLLHFLLPFLILIVTGVGSVILWQPAISALFHVELTAEQKNWVGLATLAAYISLAAYLTICAGWAVRKKFQRAEVERRRTSRMQTKVEEEARAANERKKNHEEKVFCNLEYLNKDEKRILNRALQEDSRTVVTTLHHHACSSLSSKGLLELPTGCFTQINAPFTIPLFVWQHLTESRAVYTKMFKVSEEELRPRC